MPRKNSKDRWIFKETWIPVYQRNKILWNDFWYPNSTFQRNVKWRNNPKTEKSNIKICLKECCRIAENNDVILLFEPINRFEIDSYNTLADSIRLLDKVGSDYLKLLVDSFHTNLEEDPGYVWDYLKDIVSRTGHIHLADTTRRAPGTGHFDFKTFLTIFMENGYDGFASVETIMKPSFEDVAKETSEYLRLII